MRILTISNAAWDDRNSVGNTLSNWFSGWKNLEICSLYTRAASPNNSCCNKYYSVTINDIAKNILSRQKIGRSFDYSVASYYKANAEVSVIGSVGGWKRSVLKSIIEIVYSSKIWLNNKIKSFISVFNPDIIFCFAIAEPFRYNIIRYAKGHTKAKVVIWVADDVYGQTGNMNFLTRYVYRSRYRTLFRMADKVYGVSQMLCDEYSDMYGIPIRPLYKGCDLTPYKTRVGSPIQIVYAGNLLYGRDKTLMALASEISKSNSAKTIIQLSIFSGTKVSDETKRVLNINNSSRLYDAQPYDEIKKIMSEADIVLHVESFEEQMIRNVRLSFSTKIIDCMQSGSAMMVIGPKGIASVEYPRDIDGVIVVDDLGQLSKVINKICAEPTTLLDRAKSISSFALAHHNLSMVHSMLQNDFQSLLES